MYERFEELLKKNKVTASDVSRETGVPRSTFTDWKKGRSTPRQERGRRTTEDGRVHGSKSWANMTKLFLTICEIIKTDLIQKRKMTARNLSVCKASGGFPCVSADCMKKARDGTRTREKTLITVEDTGFLIFSWANMTKKILGFKSFKTRLTRPKKKTPDRL